MKKDITQQRKFLIDRLGYLRNKANLSARELSGRVDKSIAYFAKFDNGDFSIPAEKLLDAIENCGSTPEEFFWEDIGKYKEQKELLKSFDNLSNESKETIIDLIKKLK
ncbi:MAG: hypothetical protein RR247_02685 [Clostridia bacterium]